MALPASDFTGLPTNAAAFAPPAFHRYEGGSPCRGATQERSPPPYRNTPVNATKSATSPGYAWTTRGASETRLRMNTQKRLKLRDLAGQGELSSRSAGNKRAMIDGSVGKKAGGDGIESNRTIYPKRSARLLSLSTEGILLSLHNLPHAGNGHNDTGPVEVGIFWRLHATMPPLMMRTVRPRQGPSLRAPPPGWNSPGSPSSPRTHRKLPRRR